MKPNKKLLITLGLAASLALIVYSLTHALFSPHLKARREKLLAQSLELTDLKELLNRKDLYQKDWEERGSKLTHSSTSEEAMNLWVKEILVFAQQEQIVFSKLEPQGISKSKNGSKTADLPASEAGSSFGEGELGLYLEFEGDIRKLTRFLYHLLQNDPLSKSESLSIKKEDSGKSFSYQMDLRKMLL